MTNSQAIFLGILQGVTEFLPVSSSGHLVLSQMVFGLGDEMVSFDVFVHFGSLLAVLIVFRNTIAELIRGSLRDLRGLSASGGSVNDGFMDAHYLRYVTAIVVGTIPAVVVGLSLKDQIEAVFFTSRYPVLFALAVTGVILLATLFKRPGRLDVAPARGFVVGCAQAFAIVPGISRSGITISTAIFAGIEREKAGEFSFLLSIPVILGATLFAALDLMGGEALYVGTLPIALGMIAAFLSGWISLIILMKLIRRGVMGYFGIYCLILAVAGVMLPDGGNANLEPYGQSPKGAEPLVQTITITSSLDGELQHIAYVEADGTNRPLVVALHTWSNSYDQEMRDEYFARCAERDWHCIFPEFRGPNKRPEACGSEAAVTDILDAMEWARNTFSIDPRRIFLVGASGGGHMSLQMAGLKPSVWTAVSAWVPITDIARWHAETAARELVYRENIEAVCGGVPGGSSAVDSVYSARSPISQLWRAHIIPVDINAGIHDGHGGTFGGEGSVPVGHSIRAYNELARAAGNPGDRIPDDIIADIERDERLPDGFDYNAYVDSTYSRDIHLRRESGLARLTIFEGGHEILYDAAFAWFDRF